MAPEASVRFGFDHDLALVLIALATGAAVLRARKAGAGDRRRLRLGLAALMVAGSLAEIVVGVGTGSEGWRDAAPLQLCDLSLLLGAYTLATLSRRAVEPLYFFATMGTLPALITPELPCAHATDFRFVAYFGLHGLTIVATATLLAGFGLVPGRGAWWRALLWLNAWAGLVSVVNAVAGTNYMYLRAKPTVPTPFDWLGTGPLYLPSLELAAALVFLVLDLLLVPARARGPGSGARSCGRPRSASPPPPTALPAAGRPRVPLRSE